MSRANRLKCNQYMYWSLELLMMLQPGGGNGSVGGGDNGGGDNGGGGGDNGGGGMIVSRNLERDENILSERNAVITSMRDLTCW